VARRDADNQAVKARIHRGAREIGGSRVELEAAGARLLLDLGLPLDDELAPLPVAAGLEQPDPSLLEILVSH
jgi:ribonuclease J